MIKFSIILPLYNTEKYISECISSVIDQTYKSWELIIINDGSTDNSLNIAKTFALIDNRIKIYSQKNKGVSSARNFGLKKSKGEYIMFLDSDDWYEKDLLSTIVKYNFDFLCYGYKKVYLDKSVVINDANLEINSLTSAEINIHTNHCVEGFLPLKVYLRKIINDNNIKFNEKIHYCEDLLFVDEYIHCCSSFKYIPAPIYNYRMRKSSSSFNFLNKKNLTILDAYSLFIDKYKNNNKIIFYIKYKYLLNYYKLKKFVRKKDKIRIKEIKNDEKNIFNSINISRKEKLNYLIIKNNFSLYIILKKIKDFGLKLFD